MSVKNKDNPVEVKQILQTYWRYIARYKLLMVAIIITVIAAGFIYRYLPPLVVAHVLDRLSRGDFTPGDFWGSFGGDIVLYAALSIGGGVFLWRLAVILTWSLGMRITRDIHRDIFNHLMLLDTTFHANKFGGSLVSQANKFVAAFLRIADTTVYSTLSLVLSFIFTAILLWGRAPAVVIFLLIFSLIFIAAAIKITQPVRKLGAVEASMSNKQTGFLADMVTNVMAVKSFAASGYENRRYAGATNNTLNAGQDLMKVATRRDFFFGSSTSLLSIGALVIAAMSVVMWKADIATVFLVMQYTGIISQELWQFGRGTLRDYNRALGDAEEMTAILATKTAVADKPHPDVSHIRDGVIDFNQASFNHDGANRPIFKDFTVSIPSGQKVGLVGHSGAGKTTFTSLLLRFADVDSGSITIDSQNIADISQADLRKAISYVPQEPLLFHRTLAENISYGRPNASHEEIVEAARRAHALEFIEKLPDGFNTLVGERGVKLSGGQRQRVAIARAVLKDAPILLLDEATSALDSESERLIQQALAKLMKDRTSIVIAHRLSTIAKLDRIIVLENGRIIEDGSHQELLELGGTYAKLWSHQSGGFIEQ